MMPHNQESKDTVTCQQGLGFKPPTVCFVDDCSTGRSVEEWGCVAAAVTGRRSTLWPTEHLTSGSSLVLFSLSAADRRPRLPSWSFTIQTSHSYLQRTCRQSPRMDAINTTEPSCNQEPFVSFKWNTTDWNRTPWKGCFCATWPCWTTFRDSIPSQRNIFVSCRKQGMSLFLCHCLLSSLSARHRENKTAEMLKESLTQFHPHCVCWPTSPAHQHCRGLIYIWCKCVISEEGVHHAEFTDRSSVHSGNN